jgi:hypothetical protein
MFLLLAFNSSWTSWPLNMGLTHCPETLVKDYHSTLHYTPEGRRSHGQICYPLIFKRSSVQISVQRLVIQTESFEVFLNPSMQRQDNTLYWVTATDVTIISESLFINCPIIRHWVIWGIENIVA